MINRLRLKSIVWFSHFHSSVMRLSKGRLMNKLLNLQMLLLVTKGKRTGVHRHTPLLYIKYQDSYYCAASFGGSAKHPDWFLNLSQNSPVEIKLGTCSFPVKAYELFGHERERFWEKLVEYYPPFAKYQTRTSRIIPVVKFMPNTGCNRLT